MQYSLLSRFQGCFLGMALGEQLGLYIEAQRFHPQRSPNQPPQLASFSEALPNPSLTDVHRWNPGIQSRSTTSSTQDTTWSTLALRSMESLIQVGAWRIAANESPAAQLQHPTLNGGLAIATLPIALFFHDNLVKQRRQLEETVQTWCNNSEISDQVVTFGYAIAQALKEQLDPPTFIAQTLAYLRIAADASESSTNHWFAELEHVKTLLKTGADLTTATQLWQSLSMRDSRGMDADARAIAIALYCFLSTPNDVRLAIIRAARVGCHPSIMCALTGALSGAYNSTAGIPVDWSLSPPTHQANAWELHPLQIHQLSSRLLSVWSGVYDSSTLQTSPLTVAAPWVIRPN